MARTAARFGVCILLALLLLVTLGIASVAQAAVFTVDSTTDAVDASPGDGSCATGIGECTLRAATQEANALAGADTITLPAGTYTITISGSEDVAAAGDLDITEDLTINGADESTTIVDGNNIDRVFDVMGGVTANLSGLTIRNGGTGNEKGAGIQNWGDLTLTSVRLISNNGKIGGGIYSESPSSLTLTNVTIGLNTAEDGGGIWIKDSVAGASLTDVTLRTNSATKLGGGINAEASTLTLNNVTLLGNTALEGGGIYNKGGALTQTITNVTLSNNTATNIGGGIRSTAGNLTLTNVTLNANSAATGGGIEINGGTITLKNTIVANSPSGGNCSGTITSAGYNLDSGNTCGFIGPGDLVNTDPQLVSLQDNGGPTRTHALEPLSPAIDAGTDTGAPATDQRGVARPIDGDGDSTASYDMGAYEAPEPIAIDCDFSEWTDGDGTEFVMDDEGGPDDWTNPGKLDITRFGVASNLSDTFYFLFGFDETVFPQASNFATLMDTDLDDNSNYMLAVTVDGFGETVELYSCDDTLPYGCGSPTVIKTLTTPGDYCRDIAAGPWNDDTFVEIMLPYSDIGFAGGDLLLPGFFSYNPGQFDKPKDSIFGVGEQDYYTRIEYDSDKGTAQKAPKAGDPHVSGTAYKDEGIETISEDKTIRLLVNGADAGTDITNAAGDFFITAPMNAGDAILVYIDGDPTYQGTTVSVFGGKNLHDLNIYADHVITRHDNTGSLTNADMATAKGSFSDTDIEYSVSGGALTVSGSGTELYIYTGHSFSPGGDITSPAMENRGTFDGGSGTIDVNGTFTVSDGSRSP
jgi:CSLREA domain-containing protein